MRRFFTVLLISLIILFSAAAMVRADITSRILSGKLDRALISYETVSYNEGRFELFGRTYTVDLGLLRSVGEHMSAAGDLFVQSVPDFVVGAGNAVAGAFGRIAAILGSSDGTGGGCIYRPQSYAFFG